MDDAACLRGLIAQSVHMGHHIVAKLGLVGLRRIEVEVVQVCFEGGDLRVGEAVALVTHEEGGAPSERVARYLVRLALRLRFRLKDGVEVRAWG